MNDIKTTQQREVEDLEYLAGMECSHCYGSGYCSCEGDEYHDGPCEFCGHTGRRFPGLSRECKCLCHDVNEPEWVWPSRCRGKEECGECHGTGRIPVSVETGFKEVLVDTRQMLGVGAVVSFMNGSCELANAEKGLIIKGAGETDALALFAAVKAAVEA